MGDLAASGLFGDYPFRGSVEFAVTPVQVSTVSKVSEAMYRMLQELDGYGVEGAFLRGPSYFVKALGGPSGTQVAKRLQTTSQRKNRIKFLRGRRRTEILDLLMAGDGKRAAFKVRAWNEQFPEAPILGKDISMKAVLRREKELAKKRANP
jgi:hypothetical protein